MPLFSTSGELLRYILYSSTSSSGEEAFQLPLTPPSDKVTERLVGARGGVWSITMVSSESEVIVSTAYEKSL